jgi:hypothetical protein
VSTPSTTDHVRIVGVLYIALGVIGIVAGGITLAALLAAGVIADDGDTFSVLAIIGLAIGGFLAVLSLPAIIGGWFLMQRKEWARILIVVLGILQLGNIPIGTALGAYTLWALLIDERTANAFR